MNVVSTNMNVVSTKTRLLSGLDAHAWGLRGPRCLRRALQFALALQIPMILLILTRDILAIQHVAYLYVIMSTAAIVLGIVWEALSPLAPYDIACSLDARWGMQERLQTAVEVHRRDDVQLADLLISDAVGALERMKSEKLCTAAKLPVEGYYLLATVGIASLLLCLPGIPATQPGNGAGFWTPRMSRMWHKDTKKPTDRDRENVARLKRSNSQISIGKPIFSDTNFASEVPDFASFVKSGGDRLNLLDPNRKNSHMGDKRRPYRVSLRQEHKEITAFEPDTVSAEEASERITVVDDLSKRSGDSSQHHEEIAGQSRSDTGASSDAARAERSNVLEQQGAKGPGGQDATASDSKGAEQVAHDQNGSAESRSGQIEAPALSPNGHIRDPDIRQPRFGGGQYPHNAPGAGFPEWLRGPEDPHFMDAGQGEGENTGKTNGQPGVGHAAMKEGAANTTIIPPEPKDIHLTGQLRPGDQVSYETDTSGPGAESLPRTAYKRVPNEYEFQAEEELSRDRVPFSYRAQVKTYFSNLR
jgi:hypothetical protein